MVGLLRHPLLLCALGVTIWLQLTVTCDAQVVGGSCKHPERNIDFSGIGTQEVNIKIESSTTGSTNEHQLLLSPCTATTTKFGACTGGYVQWQRSAGCDTYDTAVKLPTPPSSGKSEYLVSIYSQTGAQGTAQMEIACQKDGPRLAGNPDTNSKYGKDVLSMYLVSCLACPNADPNCGATPGGSTPKTNAFSIFLIVIVFAGGFVYVVGFSAYNYLRNEKRGAEILPHPEFWSEVPGYVKEGCVVTVSAVKGGIDRIRGGGGGGGGSSGYQAV